MKLSEAIRMNGMMKPQGRGAPSIGDPNAPCVIGGALQVVGKQVVAIEEAQRVNNYGVLRTLWMWLDQPRQCPACNARTYDAVNVLYHLNDDHLWTRQQIADWVASVEPQEEPAPQVEHELTEAIR
jgi:hypothetical protein